MTLDRWKRAIDAVEATVGAGTIIHTDAPVTHGHSASLALVCMYRVPPSLQCMPHVYPESLRPNPTPRLSHSRRSRSRDRSSRGSFGRFNLPLSSMHRCSIDPLIRHRSLWSITLVLTHCVETKPILYICGRMFALNYHPTSPRARPPRKLMSSLTSTWAVATLPATSQTWGTRYGQP